MKKNISIHDIARQLKVSATAVSFVLNGKAEEKRISNVLEKRIKDYVREIGYHPNHVAQSLRTGKSKIIAMLVEDISDPFFSSVARIIEENLYSLGYKIFHSSTNNNTLRVKALLRIFRERQVDGYIIVPSPGIENDLQHLLNQSKPVILFDRYFPGLNTSNVVIDNMGGTYKAVQHLVENRFTHIAFITLNSEQVQMVERLRGYDKAMDENRLSKYILKIDYKSAPGKITAVIKTFLERNTSINAVVFATNYLAINGLQAIRELGLSIPANIGVIGFDDNTHFALFSPAITAIAQPVVEISNQAALQLIRELTATEKIREKITAVLPTELIIRESSLQPVVIN